VIRIDRKTTPRQLSLFVALTIAGFGLGTESLLDAGQNTATGPVVVAFPATVMADRQPVGDLAVAEFEIVENGRPVEVGRMEDPSAPVPIAIVVDSSPTTNAEIDWTRDALRSLVERISPRHPVMIVEAQVVTRPIIGLSTDRNAIDAAIDRIESSGSPSNHLIDSATEALVTLLQTGNPRGAVVILTDGTDTGSRSTMEQFERAVHLAAMPVYVVAVDNVDGYTGNLAGRVSAIPAGNNIRRAVAAMAESMERAYSQQRDRWQALAESSGGGFFPAGEDDGEAAVVEPFDRVVARIEASYTFYFYSTPEPDTEGRTPLTIRTTRPGLQIHAPGGTWQVVEAEPTAER